MTRTFETVVAPVPRKLIWLEGEASGVPGWGETATGLLAAALSVAFTIRPVAGEELLPQAPSRAAALAQASTRRGMCRRGVMLGGWGSTERRHDSFRGRCQTPVAGPIG